MKKTASILALVFVFTVTTKAQKKDRRTQREKLTVDQQAILVVKKMTLTLELTKAQQQKIRPILERQISSKRAEFEKVKAMREGKRELTADERFAYQNQRLDQQIAYQKEMKSILNDKQYEKFRKQIETQKRKMRGRIGKKMKQRWLKEQKKTKKVTISF